MVDSPTKTTCAGGGVSQSKKVLLLEGRWEYLLRRQYPSPVQCLSGAECSTDEFWNRTRQTHLLRGLTRTDSRAISWDLPLKVPPLPFDSLYYILRCILPFPSESFSSQENGRRLINCNANGKHQPCCHLRTAKLDITIHSIKHFKWHNEMRGLWFQKH